jgi:hypothetical protein
MGKISNFFSRNKKWVTLTLAAVLLLALVPLHSADAAWWNVIGNIWTYIQTMPLRIVAMAVVFALFLCALGVGFVFFLAANVLQWIMTASIMVGITPGNPRTPAIITQSWTFTRDIADMLFIIIFAYIGLATILRLRDYEAKKLLPGLIWMAILINFSGVIVGLIVDISNILTNFFVSDTNTNNLSGIWQIAWNYISGAAGTIFKFTDFIQQIGDMISPIVYGIIILLFYLFSLLVYIVLVLIFLLRILMLWLLMILAPLAFAARMLPATKNLWNKWWGNLFKWSIVGIPLGFFLYISSKMMTFNPFGSSPTLTETTMTTSASSTMVIDTSLLSSFSYLIGQLLGPTMAIFLLAIGTMMSISIAPSAASGIMKAGQKYGKVFSTSIGKSVGKSAWSTAKNTPKNVVSTVKQFGQNIKNAKGGIPGKAGVAAGGLIGGIYATNQAKKLVDDYKDARKVDPKTGKPSLNKKDAVVSAIRKTGPVGRMYTAPIIAVSSAIEDFRLARTPVTKGGMGMGFKESFSQGLKTAHQAILKDKTTTGIWKAVADASKAGWKATTGEKKKKKGEKCINSACGKVQPADTDFCPFCGYKQ